MSNCAFMVRFAVALLLFGGLLAQDYVCPMDADVRSDKPGVCPRCGMKLVLGIPEPAEYPLRVTVQPEPPRAGQATELTLRVEDPRTGAAVTRFQVVHEKLCHLFLVSEDLQFFRHDHPELRADGAFHLRATFPGPGLYRLLADFYPSGGAPQLAPATIIVPGAGGDSFRAAALKPDLSAKRAATVEVALTTQPAQPIAGLKTMLFFRLTPADGLEKYLGAWGHMLAASDDLIDMIHTHPFLPAEGGEIQFNVIFPRARTYRIWVQFQRNGVVNTAAFNVPVRELN
ncbi:MAG TPA: heavy metal-binding domain-containing protein [Bryobacteraceae bacterium]|nr:heavy metal-binding domain-containing protein [Bryobacteraceae bacterium]